MHLHAYKLLPLYLASLFSVFSLAFTLLSRVMCLSALLASYCSLKSPCGCADLAQHLLAWRQRGSSQAQLRWSSTHGVICRSPIRSTWSSLSLHGRRQTLVPCRTKAFTCPGYPPVPCHGAHPWAVHIIAACFFKPVVGDGVGGSLPCVPPTWHQLTSKCSHRCRECHLCPVA